MYKGITRHEWLGIDWSLSWNDYATKLIKADGWLLPNGEPLNQKTANDVANQLEGLGIQSSVRPIPAQEHLRKPDQFIIRIEGESLSSFLKQSGAQPEKKTNASHADKVKEGRAEETGRAL